MKNELRSWEKEKKLIPIMITMYCKGNHKIERKKQCIGHSDTCTECKELIEYALFRLEKCPFKENKKFCSFCKVHCYKPEMRKKICNEVFRATNDFLASNICNFSCNTNDKV